ncbi:MAG: hypothetical protein JWO94_2873 [Verrucomicrobiaceae bacterium]|nr:hypothetical protein [Verrucomicrobiaceae bacterium]
MAASRLRLFVCLPNDTGTSLWHRQFPETLKAMGHEVIMPDGIGLSDSWSLSQALQWGKADRSNLTQRIFDAVDAEHHRQHVDLFFVYLYPMQFDPELFALVAALGIPSVYFFCDNLLHPEVASQFARHATLNWVPEKNAMSGFKAAGARALHLPMAANPARNFPTGDAESLDAAFAGGKTPFRRRILGNALDKGLDITVFGSGWIPNQISHHLINNGTTTPQTPRGSASQRFKQWRTFKTSALARLCKHGLRPVMESRNYNRMGEEFELLVQQHASAEPLDLVGLNAMHSKARVTIGINDQFNPVASPSLYFYPKMREFEATMSGACYLTQRTEETESLFEPGREIAVYSTQDEMVEKARELLASPTTRKQMRTAAALRAASDHTWQRRFETIFQELDL